MEHIRTCREAAGLNQTELARKLGIRPCAVSIMEKPGKFPEARRLPAIADACDCTIDALFGRGAPKLTHSFPDGRNEAGVPDKTILPPEGGVYHGG